MPAPPPKPPPPPESNPFLAPESSREIDAGWLEPDAIAEASLPPPAPVEASHVEPAKPKSESTAPSPARRGSRAKVIAFVVPVLVVVGGGLVYRARMTARSAKTETAAPPSSADEVARVEPSTPSAEPPPPPTFTPEAPPSASAVKKPAAAGGVVPVLSADPSKTGILDTTALPPGRKIIVDGRMVGTSPRRVVVRCGMHRIQVGDLPPESLQLPCGGEISFTD